MHIKNTNLMTQVTFSAKVEHEPASSRQRTVMANTVASRKAELSKLHAQDKGLEKAEANLAKRLWEVQETRRRIGAMANQLEEAVKEAEEALKAGPQLVEERQSQERQSRESK